MTLFGGSSKADAKPVGGAGFQPFAGGANKLPPAKETPVELKMRRTLVHRVVQHAFRCVEVQEQERKALVIQKYWRSYAANRELRRRRWALRRARAKASAIQSVLDLPGNLVKAAVKFVAAFVWSFLMSFRIFRALVWFVVRLPRALYRATYSWEGCWGVTAAATLAARNRNPNAVFLYNFQDFLTLYVVLFVMLDILAPAVVNPALNAHKSARGMIKLAVRFVMLTTASFCDVETATKIHKLALRLGVIDEMPRRYRVLTPTFNPPVVMPVRRSKDPELLKDVADAHTAAQESSRYADEAATQADELEEKLGALAVSMEVHVMNKLEAKLKAIGDMSEAQYEAAKELMAGHAGPQVVVNTAIVDERIDKRFEDMEAMLREARDEGRAEVFRELDGLGRRSGSDTDAIERGLREGMEKGVLKGIEMEKERRRRASIKYRIRAALGWKTSSEKKKAEAQRLEDLKGAIKSREFSSPRVRG